MEDQQIIQLYLQRDEQAIEETDKIYHNYCHSIAWHILFDEEDVQEILNDTWLGAWNSIPPNHPLSLSGYLGKITRNLSLKKFRDNSAQKRGNGETVLSLDELENCIADGKDIRQSVDEKFLAEIINDFLATLKERERDVFVCRYWYFDSISEIAKRFFYTPSKVKMMLKRTRDKLKDYLEKEGVIE